MKKIITAIFISIIYCTLLNKVLAYEVYEIGDKVTYRNDDYYVIENSDSDSNYIKLLKEKPLTVKELYQYSRDNNDQLMVNQYVQYYSDPEKVFYEYSDGTGGMSYYTAPGCSSFYDPYTIGGGPRRTGTECKGDYALSDVSKLLNNWSKDFQKDLIEINGQKTTLLSISELIENLGYELGYDISDYQYFYPQDIVDWLFSKDYIIWIINDLIEEEEAYCLNENGEVKKQPPYNPGAVRPVIYLSKCALGDKECEDCKKEYSTKKVTKYKEYKLYDEVEYKGEKYHVINNSKKSINFVTLLKDEPLTTEEIIKYDKSNTYDDSEFLIHYYSNTYEHITSPDSIFSRLSRDNFTYSTSNLKKIIDNWVANELDENDLMEVDGFKARIISRNEYFDIWSTDKRYIIENYTGWMIQEEPYGLYEYHSVIPLINLKKGNNEYTIGQTVTYKDNEYYVIANGDSYVTLLKKEPLNRRQILLYSNKYGVMHYYKSDTCDKPYNNSGCSNNFDTSFIKTALDNWANDKNIMNDLVKVRNYKIRLLTKEELKNKLGYDTHNIITAYSFYRTDAVPEWMYNSEYEYWTMSSEDDVRSKVYIILNQGTVSLTCKPGVDSINDSIFDYNAVRPVINLNKCALDGGCYEADEEVITSCENEVNNVDVENTLKIVSKVLLVVSIVLIIGGCVIISYNYYKTKRNQK